MERFFCDNKENLFHILAKSNWKHLWSLGKDALFHSLFPVSLHFSELSNVSTYRKRMLAFVEQVYSLMFRLAQAMRIRRP